MVLIDDSSYFRYSNNSTYVRSSKHDITYYHGISLCTDLSELLTFHFDKRSLLAPRSRRDANLRIEIYGIRKRKELTFCNIMKLSYHLVRKQVVEYQKAVGKKFMFLRKYQKMEA